MTMTTADEPEHDSGSAHDPVDGNPAAADHGPAGTHPAGIARKPRPGTARTTPTRSAAVDGDEDSTPTATPSRRPRDPGSKELVIDENGSNELDFDRLEALSKDWEDHFNEEHRPSRNGMDEEGDKKHDAMQNMASRPQSLQDYLNDQLAFLDLTPRAGQADPLRHRPHRRQRLSGCPTKLTDSTTCATMEELARPTVTVTPSRSKKRCTSCRSSTRPASAPAT